MNILQGTLARPLQFNGVGLHSGKNIQLTIYPAPANAGIYFQRVDLKNQPPILAHPYNVSSTVLCTTIGKGVNIVSTIEHLMAAFVGLGIDNAFVCVNAPELPILDGSSAPFVDQFLEVGVQRQKIARKIYGVKTPLVLKNGDQMISLSPHSSDCCQCSPDSLVIDYTISFPRSPFIGNQRCTYEINQKNFLEICEARTFCQYEDVTSMRQNGLALGGSLDNSIVVDGDKILNNESLRYKDEFVRHKLLDCVGDLGLLGGKISGHLHVIKGGHKLHAQFVEALYERLLDEDIKLPSEVSCDKIGDMFFQARQAGVYIQASS